MRSTKLVVAILLVICFAFAEQTKASDLSEALRLVSGRDCHRHHNSHHSSYRSAGWNDRYGLYHSYDYVPPPRQAPYWCRRCQMWAYGSHYHYRRR